MASYYLDIETTGLDEVMDKIITIQWAELERNTGKLIGDIHILKEWESDERTIVDKFRQQTDIVSSYEFDFIPVGYNLKFEHKFILEKSSKYFSFPISVLFKPHIDLHSIGILLNKGEFKDSGLDKLTNKPTSGEVVLEYYKNREYDKIEEYIKTEAIQFSYFFEWCHRELPKMRLDLKQYLNERKG